MKEKFFGDQKNSSSPSVLSISIPGSRAGGGIQAFVYRLAMEMNITGMDFRNSIQGVFIEAEGDKTVLETISSFRLQKEIPASGRLFIS